MSRQALAAEPEQDGRAIRLLLAASLAALLVTVLLTPIPPLEDYPNHLARLWLIGGGARVPPVSSMYGLQWDTLTNIGMDLLALPLSRLFAFETIGRLFVAAAVVLPPLGGIVLWQVLHGRSCWWQLAFVPLAWNLGVLTGFLNFQIALGLALLAAAAEPALARRGTAAATAGRALLGALILVVHLFGLVFYLALIGGLALGADFRLLGSRQRLFQRFRLALTCAAGPLLAAAAIFLVAPKLPGAQSGEGFSAITLDFLHNIKGIVDNPEDKIKRFCFGILTYSVNYDLVFVIFYTISILLSLVRRTLHVHRGLLFAVAGLTACFIVCPFEMAGTAWVDTRFAAMVPLALTVALLPRLPQSTGRLVAAFLLVIVLGARPTSDGPGRRARPTWPRWRGPCETSPRGRGCCRSNITRACGATNPGDAARCWAKPASGTWPRWRCPGGTPSCRPCSPPVASSLWRSCRHGVTSPTPKAASLPRTTRWSNRRPTPAISLSRLILLTGGRRSTSRWSSMPTPPTSTGLSCRPRGWT